MATVLPMHARADTAAPAEAAGRMEPGPKELENVGVDEKLGEQVPLNLGFTNSEGQKVTLGQIISGRRPVILTLNYSSCPMLCSLQLDALVEGMRGIAWTAGVEYDIVTVSIDPNESVDRNRLFKEKYLNQYQREPAKEGWHFLQGTEVNIETVARSVGFKYTYVKERQEYAHTAAIMLLSPEGVVTRYLYGVLYEPRDLRFALVEAAEGKVGSTVDRILLYCFHYDAAVGKYAPFAANIMRLGGVLTVIVLGGLLGGFWLRDAKKQRIPLG